MTDATAWRQLWTGVRPVTESAAYQSPKRKRGVPATQWPALNLTRRFLSGF
jgi:hypothetical protein